MKRRCMARMLHYIRRMGDTIVTIRISDVKRGASHYVRIDGDLTGLPPDFSQQIGFSDFSVRGRSPFPEVLKDI